MDFYYKKFNLDYNEIDCEVKLQNQELWKKFYEIGTEMIITKSGRRMFPALKMALTALEPAIKYSIFLEFIPTSEVRYKYSGDGWTSAGGGEPHSPCRIYCHPDSPATGNHWMSQPVSFDRLKLTNSAMPQQGQVVLNSMHKYRPRMVIQAENGWARSFEFKETEFIAVTAYQNDNITKLKIDNNPFAKGFRENGQSRCKRKLKIEEDKKDEISSPKRNEIFEDNSSSSSSPEPIISKPIQTSVVYSQMNFRQNFSYLPPNYQYPEYYPVPTSLDYNFCTYNNFFNSYSCLPQFCWGPQKCTDKISKIEKPKRFTDFSIKAITES